jgi:hypothetical protein
MVPEHPAPANHFNYLGFPSESSAAGFLAEPRAAGIQQRSLRNSPRCQAADGAFRDVFPGPSGHVVILGSLRLGVWRRSSRRRCPEAENL